MAEVRGRELVYLRPLTRAVQSQLIGFGPTAADYDFRVENRRTRAGIRQIGDRPMTKINVWSPATAVCPEAFVDVRADPGGEDAWAIRYEFYEVGR
jgi:hypothetical protein